MSLGDTSPGVKGMNVAAHEASEERGYLVVVFAGEEATDPVVVSELSSLLDLLGKLALIVSASNGKEHRRDSSGPLRPNAQSSTFAT